MITQSEHGFGLKGPADLFNNFVFTETFLRGRTKPSWLGGTKKVKALHNIFLPPASSKATSGLYLTDKRASNRPFFENLPLTENSIYFTENKSDAYQPKTELGNDLFTDKPAKDSVKLLYADPLFDQEAMKKGIFGFQKDSPAEKLGVKPIDLREVGSSLAPSSFSEAGAEAKTGAKTSTEVKSVTFEFTDGSALDGKQGIVGAAMSAGGVTLTTRQIIGSDKTDQGNTTTIFKNSKCLSINTKSVSGSEYQNLDPGEAWVFDFDSDVVLNTIELVGLDRDETMAITVLDGSHGGAGAAHKVSGKSRFTFGQALAAGTAVRIEQTTGKARIGSISLSRKTK